MININILQMSNVLTLDTISEKVASGHTAFKYARGKIVTGIIPSTAQTNESRDGIYNIDYAKHRCSEFNVTGIYEFDPATNKFTQSLENTVINSLWNERIAYTVGCVAIPDSFDPQLHNHCSNGIHYYRSVAAAWCNHQECGYDGRYKTYHDNGCVKCGYDLVNGKVEGVVIEYHDNGQKYMEYTCIDGNKEGLFTVYTKLGHKACTRYCIGGKLEGRYTEYFTVYHTDGRKSLECDYIAGKREGPWRVYYDNGAISVECTYKNDIREGTYTEYDRGGTPKIILEYVNGEYKHGHMPLVLNSGVTIPFWFSSPQ